MSEPQYDNRELLNELLQLFGGVESCIEKGVGISETTRVHAARIRRMLGPRMTREELDALIVAATHPPNNQGAAMSELSP